MIWFSNTSPANLSHLVAVVSRAVSSVDSIGSRSLANQIATPVASDCRCAVVIGGLLSINHKRFSMFFPPICCMISTWAQSTSGTKGGILYPLMSSSTARQATALAVNDEVGCQNSEDLVKDT